jgi:acetoin utilization deacetylase AcuC-like enzyme
MPKFGKIYRHLVSSGMATLDQFRVPAPASREVIELAHAPAYVEAYCSGMLDARAMRRIGLPWSEGLVRRTVTAVGGTLLTIDLALAYGLAASTAGGTHHAFAEFGSGFCIFNDMAIGARWAIHTGRARRVLIVDLDVHQGDGTAAICAGDDAIFTFSMHCGDNFPFRKQTGDRDIELPVGMGDDGYLAVLREALPDLLTGFRPDLVIYDGGVDPHRDDKLGKLALTDQGLYRRDRYVLDACVAAGIPVAGVIGGGYDDDHDRLARRHCTLHHAAADAFNAHRL